MNVVVITPPLVQLNSPYPSGAYLNAYFKKQGCKSVWYDLSIKLFYSIFSKEGLKKLFDLTQTNALIMAEQAEANGDESTAYNLRRYISFSESWVEWIDWITGILCDGNIRSGREKAHQFLYSPYAPRGNRMEQFLANLDHEPTVDDVRFLCSFALADLSDYITAVFDSNFSLIRYAESLTVDERNFSQIEKNLDSPVLKNFYLPVLQQLDLCKEFNVNIEEIDEKLIVCISVPFAGTFVPALYTARYFKQIFGNKVYVCAGGGFVNTELRQAKEKALSKYLDAFCYDRGYGSYNELLKKDFFESEKSVYKLRQFTSEKIIEPVWENKNCESYESEVTAEIIPDYSDIDFGIYPRVCDDKNPMHRLWTDGGWIKAYLAHGCYWHKCAFCDTALDYVCGYKPVKTEALYNGLAATAKEKGVYGIHFVDEALPPKMLKDFSLMNCRNPDSSLYFWGNVRFEKSFTKDLAAFLSYGGLGGVSAGLEVATGEGLKNINKGTDIESIVSACCAFKEAGILVHAYMIYGFWYDTPQTIIDSMETLRQFFAAGLLDSAFWHKFVLTRNSTVYTEWQKGLHKNLKPIENKKHSEDIFADNNLHFEGENKYAKFGNGLDCAVNAWMHGEKLDMKVQKWFDFSVPSPGIPRDFIERYIEKYEQKNEKAKHQVVSVADLSEKVFWLGGKPVQKNNRITWIYLQEMEELNKSVPENFCKMLIALRPEAGEDERKSAVEFFKTESACLKLLNNFRNRGLVLL